MTSPVSDPHPPTPPVQPAPSGPTSSSAGETAYALALVPDTRGSQAPRRLWWRTLLSLLIPTVGLLIVSSVATIPVVMIEIALGVRQPDDVSMSVGVMAVTTGALGLLIPISLLTQRWLYGVRPLSSVAGRLRWRILAPAVMILLVLMGLYMGLAPSLGPDAVTEERSMGETLGYLAIVLFIIPFQAAGEEYAFRGLVNRAVTASARRSKYAVLIGMIVSSVVFATMHFAEDPWLIAYYLLFGMCMAVVVHITGGLEVAIAFHVANNMVAFAVTILSGGSMEMDRSMGSGGPFMLVQMGVIVAVTLVTWLIARRRPQWRAVPASR